MAPPNMDWRALAAAGDPAALWRQQKDRVAQVREWAELNLAGGSPKPLFKRPAPKKKAYTLGRTHLVIGDSHSDPKVPNDRYRWLGELALDRRPDVIVDIGDWGTFTSLSYYAKDGSSEAEGTRYADDVAAYVEAQWQFQKPIDDYNRPFGENDERRYEPRKIRTLGNHEWRIITAVSSAPRKFEGVIGVWDLMSKEFGWEEYPYLQPVTVDGVTYCHQFKAKGRSRGSSKYGAFHLGSEEGRTTCYGHTHDRKHAIFTNSAGHRWHSINVGCYFDHFEMFAETDNFKWNRGLQLLHNVKNGDFDDEWIGFERVRKLYG